MNEKEFEEKLENKCSFGTGGAIFKKHYLEAKQNPNAVEEALEQLMKNVEDELKETKKEMDDGLKDHDTMRIYRTLQQIQNMPTNSISEILDVFDLYFYECTTCQSCPELMGTLVGGVAYHQLFGLAMDFLGFNGTMIVFDS